MLPFLEVTHLPSSSSFYSAILQPLGLQYLSSTTSSDTAPSGTEGEGTSIVFGEPPPSSKPVFQIRQVRPTDARPLKVSHLVLSAPSAQAVRDFQSCALRANPPPKDPHPRPAVALLLAADAISATSPSGPPDSSSTRSSTSTNTTPTTPTATGRTNVGGEILAKITDFDGNKMEVSYISPTPYGAGYHGDTYYRGTQSSLEDISRNRIMDWNYDIPLSGPSAVSRSHVSRSGASAAGLSRRPGRYAADLPSPDLDQLDQQPPYVLRRSVTTTTTTSSLLDEDMNALSLSSPRESPRGLTTASVVGFGLFGAAVGAAAGAAVTYGMMRSDHVRAPQQQFDHGPPPAFARRSTYPKPPYPEPRRGRQFIELEHSMSRFSHPDEYPGLTDGHSPPAYIAHYSQTGRGRTLDDLGAGDALSTHSSRYRPPPSVRSRSQATMGRAPLMLTETEHRSYTGSRHSAAAPPPPPAVSHPPTLFSTSRRSAYEGESYVSARSHKTASTLRAAPAMAAAAVYDDYIAAPAVTSSRSRATSRHTPSATPRLPRTTSYVSARDVPLPYSTVGSSRAGYDEPEDDNDDANSIAPSESISCVGSRRSGRSHH